MSNTRDYPIDPAAFTHLTAVVVESGDIEMKDALARAIDRLDGKHRDVLNAVIWEGTPKRALARLLKLSRVEVDRVLAESFELVRIEMGWSRDAYYEAKKAKGQLVPPSEYLSETELSATLHGRSRGDGRRIDAYSLDDPCEWRPKK